MKYVIFSYWNKQCISNYMLYDLSHAENVLDLYIYKSEMSIKNNYVRGMYNFIFDQRWLSKEKRTKKMLKKITTMASKENIAVLMTNELLCHLELEDLHILQRSDAKLVLILIDPLSAQYKTAEIAKETINKIKFDLIFSFDPKDAAKYGFEYCNTLYSKLVDSQAADICYDLCYIGNIKDRRSMLLNLLDKANASHSNVFMKLSGCSDDDKSLLPAEIVLEKIIDYTEIINYTKQSNCIFDMTQAGQSGVTLRYYEAIVYNKKLLTNNRKVANMPFFDERYVRFYEEIEDIDWEWVKKVEDIDYGYNGEFSPIRILERIERFFHE